LRNNLGTEPARPDRFGSNASLFDRLRGHRNRVRSLFFFRGSSSVAAGRFGSGRRVIGASRDREAADCGDEDGCRHAAIKTLILWDHRLSPE
jgi:hypothetical protein